MALGDYNNNKPKYKELEVYSNYGMTNAEGVVDPSALSISFFRNLMKISIAPKLQNANGNQKWDNDNAASVYLTHTKARVLHKAIKDVLDPEKPQIKNAGVNSGSGETVGLITFSDGTEMGLQNPCLIIRKIGPNGEVLSMYIYEFKFNYHNAIINFDGNSASYDQIFFDNLEVEQFMDALNQYYLSMNNATAYSVANTMKFSLNAMDNKLNAIAEACGANIEKPGNSGGGNSFFSNNRSGGSTPSTEAPGNSVRQSTLDDLDS